MRVRQEEVKNSDKQMKNLMNEYQRLQKRLAEVSDPSYIITLKDQISQADDTIKSLKKEKKNLEVEQFRRERKMDKIITYGEPENVKSINDTAKELEVVSQKMRRLKEKKEQLEEFKL
jgi:translation initiation factor 2B subunit (eIF-2B alpha/beta/delta family)